LALTALSLFFLVNGNRGLWKMAKLQQEKSVLAREVERLRADVERYRLEISATGSNLPSIEKQAREELNLVKPGEIIYKFGPLSR
jgi:cell division protein FtsB